MNRSRLTLSLVLIAVGLAGCGGGSGGDKSSDSTITVKTRADLIAESNKACKAALGGRRIDPISATNVELNAFAGRVGNADAQLGRFEGPKKTSAKAVQKWFQQVERAAHKVVATDRAKAQKTLAAQLALSGKLLGLETVTRIVGMPGCAVPFTHR